MKFMNENILTDSQFGFRTNNSTELAVTSIYDKLLQNLDNKKVTCSIFLDLKKHLILLTIVSFLRNHAITDFVAIFYSSLKII